MIAAVVFLLNYFWGMRRLPRNLSWRMWGVLYIVPVRKPNVFTCMANTLPVIYLLTLHHDYLKYFKNNVPFLRYIFLRNKMILLACWLTKFDFLVNYKDLRNYDHAVQILCNI